VRGQVEPSHDDGADELGGVAADARKVDDQDAAVVQDLPQVESRRRLPHDPADDGRGQGAEFVQDRRGHLGGELFAESRVFLGPEHSDDWIGDAGERPGSVVGVHQEAKESQQRGCGRVQDRQHGMTEHMLRAGAE